MRRSNAFVAAACITAALLLAADSGEKVAVFDALLDGRKTLPLSELAELASLDPDQAFRAVEIGRGAHTSHHVVSIRDRELPHRHDRHDLVVVILRGQGRMRLEDSERPIGEGSILYVPRGKVHAFSNESDEPAVAYAMYTPAFDGVDRVTLD